MHTLIELLYVQHWWGRAIILLNRVLKACSALSSHVSSITAHGQPVISLGVIWEHRQASCILVHAISLSFRPTLPPLEFAAGWLEVGAATVAGAGMLLIIRCLRVRCAV